MILGCSGHRLTSGEKWFFREADPWGFILFARNCQTREQIRSLVGDLKEAVGRETLPILIDQEGGRVARLKPPEWPEFASAATFGAMWRQNPDLAREALSLSIRLMAHELRELGITVDCIPVADVPQPEEHGIIGDRAYATNPEDVAQMAGFAARTLLREGILPVVKHIPGHGRARVDSHEDLPVVATPRKDLDAVDFEAFRPLTDLPLAMTAHVVYSDIDPTVPATLSKTVIEDVIRGAIGFDGLLMTDDLSMKALKGSFADRTSTSLAAGCDVVLHCNGTMSEMVEIASVCPILTGEAARRAEQACGQICETLTESLDVSSAWDKLSVILGKTG
jgi:beta-N-acetylhexosaminidase